MELLEQYTGDQSTIPWKSIFEGLQDYRRKAIELSMKIKRFSFKRWEVLS